MIERIPEVCPHRTPVSEDGVIQCRVMRGLFGGDHDFSIVPEDICRACCRSFLPSMDDLNPVVASLVWSRTEEFLRDGSSRFSALERLDLRHLQHFAEASIPLVPADDIDLPPAPRVVTSAHRISVEEVKIALPSPVTTGSRMGDWAVGVTIAPRRVPTLNQCLPSLLATGWERPHLFLDGKVVLPESADGLPLTRRDARLGAWHNYRLAVADLLKNESAKFVMLVQDDAWWPPHLPIRDYLEQIQWPALDRFVVSAYCCTDDTAATAGWREYKGIWKYGAVAMIFSRCAAEEFVSDPKVCGYGPEQMDGIDSIIGDWAERRQVPVFVPTPSLVQHVGDVSTLWRTSRAVGLRRASRFIGDEILPG